MTERLNLLRSHLEAGTTPASSEPSTGETLNCNPTAGIRMGGGVDVKEIMRRVKAWHNYVDAVVPKKIAQIKAENRPRADVAQEPWAQQPYDVVVLGFGGAGAAAALDAADNGKRVLLVDRFEGGGSTRRSGGIYYAGGGTRAQKEAGVEDSVDNMFEYIKYENGGAVDEETVRAFCEQSPETFKWLEERVGVRFLNDEGETVYYAKKTSYPPSTATLYQSGNESAAPYNGIAKPAARGNRPFGDYLTGNVFFGAFEKAVEAHENITVRANAPALKLHVEDGKCLRVTLRCVPASPEWRDVESMHNMLHEIGSGSAMFSGRHIDRMCREREQEVLSEFGGDVTVHPTNGVIIACGGFYFNEELIDKYAPKYNGFMPLGNLGDDGSGIQLALDVGAQLDRMDRCSAWKFINPPYSFVRGLLINSKGDRVGNEDVYGATFADFLIQKHAGKGWLLIDQKQWDEANEDCLNPESGLQEDQRMQGLANLHRNYKVGDTWEELANECDIPVGELKATVDEYNRSAKAKVDTTFGKREPYLEALDKAPYYAINLDMVGNKFWPTPCMSLGGIRVEGSSGRVIHSPTNKPIEGLYAAGRSAVGIASNYYVSGLSLADCIFSGRRAGRHISR